MLKKTRRKTKNTKSNRSGSKILKCDCGRESYSVSSSCDKVTCWRCLQIDRTKALNERISASPRQPKEEERIRVTRQARHVNPIDPKTGKRKRGRPPKNKPTTEELQKHEN